MLLLVTEPLLGWGLWSNPGTFRRLLVPAGEGGTKSVDTGRTGQNTHTDKQEARLWLQGKKGTASRTGTVVVEKRASRPADLPLGQRHCQQCRVEACPMACDRHTPRKQGPVRVRTAVRDRGGRVCPIDAARGGSGDETGWPGEK